MPKSCNIVVFDLDETLGHFVELGMFQDCLEHWLGKSLTQREFNQMLDLYPEFLRPHIIPILKYIVRQRRHKRCNEIMIYTNNQGPREWTLKIRNYFNYKLNCNVFDQVICAYKVNGKQIELCRSTHKKTVDDLIRCSKIPYNTRVCFIDDQYHEKMIHDNVDYINAPPYNYPLSFKTMATRYLEHSNVTNPSEFIKNITQQMKLYNYPITPSSEKKLNMDKIVGKKIMKYLKDFFKNTNTPTIRNRTKKINILKSLRRTKKRKHPLLLHNK